MAGCRHDYCLCIVLTILIVTTVKLNRNVIYNVDVSLRDFETMQSSGDCFDSVHCLLTLATH